MPSGPLINQSGKIPVNVSRAKRRGKAVLGYLLTSLVTVPGETKGNHDGDRHDAEDHEAGKIQALGEQSEGPAKAGYKGGQDYGADEVSHVHGHNLAERIVNKRLIPLNASRRFILHSAPDIERLARLGAILPANSIVLRINLGLRGE
jgi:hypothetical protein